MDTPASLRSLMSSYPAGRLRGFRPPSWSPLRLAAMTAATRCSHHVRCLPAALDEFWIAYRVQPKRFASLDVSFFGRPTSVNASVLLITTAFDHFRFCFSSTPSFFSTSFGSRSVSAAISPLAPSAFTVFVLGVAVCSSFPVFSVVFISSIFLISIFLNHLLFAILRLLGPFINILRLPDLLLAMLRLLSPFLDNLLVLTALLIFPWCRLVEHFLNVSSAVRDLRDVLLGWHRMSLSSTVVVLVLRPGFLKNVGRHVGPLEHLSSRTLSGSVGPGRIMQRTIGGRDAKSQAEPEDKPPLRVMSQALTVGTASGQSLGLPIYYKK
ncbi:hypothetical protein MTO96_031364 [Rhipicephalus appendiculatus]